MSKNNFYINSQAKLERVVDLIKKAKLVAVDTEFTRETTYYPVLSIVQIAVKNSAQQKESFIIDCLSDLDLSELFAAITDPKITKILHSSAQDLQIFHRKSNLLPQGIADTQVMANFCGLGFNIGYSGLVENFFQTSLDKGQQRSDWQARPLTPKQIEYALLDVFFLEEIYQNCFEILEQKNRLDWYLEEIKTFVNKSLFRPDEALSRNFSFRGKSSKQICQIKDLILWRELQARRVDVPRQHFLRDEAIERIVENQKFDRGLSSAMIAEIKKVLEEKEEFFDKTILEDEKEEKRFAMTSRQKNLFQEAKKLISEIAVKENFQEQFLITSSDLKRTICEKDNFNKIVFGWRYQVFGKELEHLLS